MASILVVCSGNICRSPIAEGLLRRAIHRRSDVDVPAISSAGTIAMEGTPATREAVAAARERGVDISRHIAHRLTDPMIVGADLLVCMAAEHREEIDERVPGARDRTFTLKELTRLLERDATPADIGGRVAAAARGRDEGVLTEMDRFDEDVVDPLGMPLETYLEIASELEDWTERLAAGLAGPVPARAEGA
jgi:low molecular weight protein-tyrosine phosphatase